MSVARRAAQTFAYSLNRAYARFMANANLIGSAKACQVLDIDRSTLSRWVKAGTLTPAMKLPGKNGAMLFDPQDVNRVCLDRAELAK